VLLAAAVLSLAGLAYPAATVRQRTVAAAELPAPDPVSRAGRGC
jgi:hypothetical protein